MVYKEFQGEQLSALGFGTMRLPQNSKDESDINVELTRKMVEYAFDAGVNYFDTAWGYHNGMSETVIGEILADLPREKIKLADKFPGYDLRNMPKVEEIFEEQLKKCRVEYFDFYLVHNVCELNIDHYLNPKYGIYPYLMEQKEKGRIRHLGFSCHGGVDVLRRFLEAYGEGMEFGQLQLNYLDWDFQNAKEKAEILAEHDIPIWVMEPLRGGSLAKLAPEAEAKLKAMRPDETIPGWAFRFLQSLSKVTVVLSGMSDLDQMKANIQTFQTQKPLRVEEMQALFDIARGMVNEKTLPCTACRYCTSHCPMELPIPDLLAMYNEHIYTGGGFLAPMKMATYPRDKRPAACIGCRSCEAVCPQQIKISEALADFAELLSHN